jgi:hypothetical protein
MTSVRLSRMRRAVLKLSDSSKIMGQQTKSFRNATVSRTDAEVVFAEIEVPVAAPR